MRRFTQTDLDKITQATQIAEKKTSAEIVTVIARKSDNYASVSLIFAVLITLIFSIALILSGKTWVSWIHSFYWETNLTLALVFFLLTQSLLFIIIWLIGHIPWLKFNLIPRNVLANTVRTSAESAFYRHKIGATQGATGVLFYISFFERRVELLVDTAIAAQIPEETWQNNVDEIIRGIKENRFIDALSTQIQNCGEHLAPLFPIQPDDVNELSDNPIIEL